MDTSKIIAMTRGKPAPERLYFRVGHNDHLVLEELLAASRMRADGLLFDARRHQRHESLRQQADQADVATCLDTQVMELAMPGTQSKGHAELPWARIGRGKSDAFSQAQIEALVQGIVARTVEGQFRQVLAPTHYLTDLSSSWREIDERLASELRAQLDDADQDGTEVIFPLAIHHQAFYDPAIRSLLKKSLRGSRANVVSLRIQPFGHDSGPRGRGWSVTR
jgi:hypothetical protein